MSRSETWWGDGRLREQWNDLSRTYTAWDVDGAVVDERPYTDEENTAADERGAAANAQAVTAATLADKMGAALATNAAFLAVASPTAAQVREQTKALTRQMSAAIRYITGALDSTDGT